jgi:uncharacterized RDD family membrane protein YckC
MPDASESLLERRFEIETPERVQIVHDLAGIGSRFAAGVIDVAFVVAVVVVVGLALLLLLSGVAVGDEGGAAAALAAAGFASAVLFGYYVGFEALWAGQTPGKRMLRLRVVSEDGGPASFGAIVVRNVLRVVDLMPGVAPYGVAGVVMFVGARAKRVGDFAAGTVVVRERAETAPLPSSAFVGESSGDEVSRVDLERLRSFLSRAPQMIAASRASLARRLADEFAARHDIAYADAEEFLRLVAEGRSPAELRDAQGPRT